VFVFRQPANESLVNLDNATQFLDILDQRYTDAMRHVPSGFERPETHVTPEWQCHGALGLRSLWRPDSQGNEEN
jgi:hypothetical protein